MRLVDERIYLASDATWRWPNIYTGLYRTSVETDSSTAPVGAASASKKHFFRRTKIPYPDKSRLFDRGFPGRAVYFTYKVTRWITRVLFFARLPGITFLNGFYVLNSNGARFARMPLRTHAPRATPPAGTLRTISVSHPPVPLDALLRPSPTTPSASDTRAQCQPAGFSRWARYRCVRRAPASFARLSPELRGQEL